MHKVYANCFKIENGSLFNWTNFVIWDSFFHFFLTQFTPCGANSRSQVVSSGQNVGRENWSRMGDQTKTLHSTDSKTPCLVVSYYTSQYSQYGEILVGGPFKIPKLMGSIPTVLRDVGGEGRIGAEWEIKQKLYHLHSTANSPLGKVE